MNARAAMSSVDANGIVRSMNVPFQQPWHGKRHATAPIESTSAVCVRRRPKYVSCPPPWWYDGQDRLDSLIEASYNLDGASRTGWTSFDLTYRSGYVVGTGREIIYPHLPETIRLVVAVTGGRARDVFMAGAQSGTALGIAFGVVEGATVPWRRTSTARRDTPPPVGRRRLSPGRARANAAQLLWPGPDLS